MEKYLKRLNKITRSSLIYTEGPLMVVLSGDSDNITTIIIECKWISMKKLKSATRTLDETCQKEYDAVIDYPGTIYPLENHGWLVTESEGDVSLYVDIFTLYLNNESLCKKNELHLKKTQEHKLVVQNTIEETKGIVHELLNIIKNTPLNSDQILNKLIKFVAINNDLIDYARLNAELITINEDIIQMDLFLTKLKNIINVDLKAKRCKFQIKTAFDLTCKIISDETLLMRILVILTTDLIDNMPSKETIILSMVISNNQLRINLEAPSKEHVISLSAWVAIKMIEVLHGKAKIVQNDTKSFNFRIPILEYEKTHQDTYKVFDKQKILIVDPNFNERIDIYSKLCEMNLRPILASDGSEANEIVSVTSDIKLILLDTCYNDALKEIKDNYPEIHIILMGDINGSDMIKKPIDTQRLYFMIKDII
jgi:hypothetical protein